MNALLTNLDELASHSNVLILTTSNITSAIDDAFLDRADIKQYIGNPSLPARYSILKSCVEELIRVGILFPNTKFKPYLQIEEDGTMHSALLQVAKTTEGLSGRCLRKLPTIAHAYTNRTTLSVRSFLKLLDQAAITELAARQEVGVR